MRTARGHSVLEALARSAQPAPTAPCLQPGCPEQCTWTDSPGRPALFCSRACQEMFKRDVARLRAEIAILENELEGDHDDAGIGIIRSHLARRRWHLKRYQPPPA